MATPTRQTAPRISANISTKLHKWIGRATVLVKEKRKNCEFQEKELYCHDFDPGIPYIRNEQRSKPVTIPKFTMSSSRPRQRKLSSITPPNLEKIVEQPRMRKMSAPCRPRQPDFLDDKNQKSKSLARKDYTSGNTAGLQVQYKDSYLNRSSSDGSLRNTYFESETGGIIAANINSREINNNDDVVQDQGYPKKLVFDINEPEAPTNYVNIAVDTPLNENCLVNNVRVDCKKANKTLFEQELRASCSQETKMICTEPASPSPSLRDNRFMEMDGLSMPAISQQITARLQKWVEKATKRAICRERKYSEDSVSSSGSNTESASPSLQPNTSWGTKGEPAEPRQILELESALKELVTSVGLKGGRAMTPRNSNRSREASLSQASDCSDSSSAKLSDFRADDSSDCTAGKEQTAVFSDERIISKIGLTNEVSTVRSSSFSSTASQESDSSIHSSDVMRRPVRNEVPASYFTSQESKIRKGKANDLDDIKYSKNSRSEDAYKADQQVNKTGIATQKETKEIVIEEINSSKKNFEEHKVPTIVEPEHVSPTANPGENWSREDKTRREQRTSSTSDDEKSGHEKKLPKQKPPRPPRPNFHKRNTSPNPERLKVSIAPKRESMPEILDFRDSDIAEFAEACVKQASRKGKLHRLQKIASCSENIKQENHNGNVSGKQILPNRSLGMEKLQRKQLLRRSENDLLEIEMETTGIRDSDTLSRPTESTDGRRWSFGEQGLTENNDVNEQQLYHEFENMNKHNFSEDGEKYPNFIEKHLKGKKGSTPRLYKFPSLPIFYRPKSPKPSEKQSERTRKFSQSGKSRSSETDDSEQAEAESVFRSRSGTSPSTKKSERAFSGRKRSGTLPSYTEDLYRDQASSTDPFYHGPGQESLANGRRRSTISAESLLINIPQNGSKENPRKITPSDNSKSSSRRRKISLPCPPIAYVEELV